MAAARPALVWLREDLRLADNPALAAAAQSGRPVLCVYVLDDDRAWSPGGASRWWLHHSLVSLCSRLEEIGGRIVLRRGASAAEIDRLVEETGAEAVLWNRRYAVADRNADAALKRRLSDAGIEVKSFNGRLLFEPWEIQTGSGTPYRVFTPFWRTMREKSPSPPCPAPKSIDAFAGDIASDALDDWALLPTTPNWAKEIGETWTPGEPAAQARLDAFLKDAAARYATERDRPDIDATSRLSPHLAFGEISPRVIWSVVNARIASGDLPEAAGEKFLQEVAWREFSYSLLHYNDEFPSAPLQAKFADFPWNDDPDGLEAWRRGTTGYPIVDAGMRQLWRTGWMHNRVRMIVGSFLVKDLRIDWREGARWFWDTLVDADLANNSQGWQWIAGCGADAAPYFRIFNPVKQGEKFDPDGNYVREYCPELSRLPDRFIHAPWNAPEDVLHKAGVVLGETYPKPVLDHAAARRAALEALESVRDAK